MRTLYARSVQAMSTLQLLLSHCKRIMDAVRTWKDAVGTLCGSCRKAVRTLCAHCNRQIWFFWWPHSMLTDFLNVVQTRWHGHLVWQGLDLSSESLGTYRVKSNEKHNWVSVLRLVFSHIFISILFYKLNWHLIAIQKKSAFCLKFLSCWVSNLS